ncbi:MAG: dienelactone hydrolase family protein [Acidimicrobiia bacterium]|nr:dienelactone hydrolase family protein [Acidimicrobiia bacterium]MYB74280.1 dienelactone hydrolase family protein [Acidimicrobiia bacterium]
MSRLAVALFCMGSGFAILYAARAPIGVRVDFYGAVPKELQANEGICPVVGGDGGWDRVFGSHAGSLRGHLRELGVEYEVSTYPEPGHSLLGRCGRL